VNELIYELARTREEAVGLMKVGCGYETKEAAEKAKKDALKDGADSFYINQLKVFRLLRTIE
jgi:hypothetical protein